MPSPLLIGNTFYLKIRVPAELKNLAKNRIISLPIGDTVRPVKIGDFVKVSLDTRDPREAKQRFAPAYVAVQAFWSALKEGPKPLSQKQSLAIAGEIRAAFVAAFDDDPGMPETWEGVLAANTAAQAANLNPLTIPTLAQQASDMEKRFGRFADIVLASKSVIVAPQYRARLLQHVADALNDMARVNRAKASGDYSDSGETKRYPEFEQPPTPASTDTASDRATFKAVVDKEVQRRSLGKDAVPLRRQTEKKFRVAVEEFAAFRKSDDITTVTAEQADAWMMDMLAKAVLSNNTIKQRLQNLRTVVQWARKQSLGKLLPSGNPLELVTLPDYQSVASDERTYTMAEAKQVLLAARKETKPELRWIPWICAYSGARINEIAQLTRGDFFQVGDDWFYRLTTSGGKTLKTRSSERRVPVHPDLIKEGLMDFITGMDGKESARMFPPRSQPNISEWLREDLKITREKLAPNHGWRHLFEDVCLVGGVLDAARNYITGRSTGKSGEGYGKSEAMLPGLANEMRKVPSFL
jgi:integrase